jgi:phosphate transport system protein
MDTFGQGRPCFQQQLHELEHSMLTALDMSLTQLQRVLDAMQRRDVRLARYVVTDDARIDGRYLKVHAGVLSLLALQAPVGGDLRLVVAVLHVINGIERIGDQCANIAKLIALFDAQPCTIVTQIIARIVQMGALARDELAQARVAFATRDVELADTLAEQDHKVDRLQRAIFCLAVQAGEQPHLREWAMSMTLVARALERIGDQALDIGEQAIFVATGQCRKLSSALKQLQRQ